MSESFEHKLATIIAEHVEICYQLRSDGLVNPSTIRVTGTLGAAHMAFHFVKQHLENGALVAERD